MELKHEFLGDDYGVFHAITLYSDQREVWRSSYYESYELYQENQIQDLRIELDAACYEYKLKYNTESNDLDDWKIIEEK